MKLTFPAIGCAAAVLTCLLFALWRMLSVKESGEKRRLSGRLLNAVGFGFLPAAAVWKIFSQYIAAKGDEVFEPLPALKWLTEGGLFQPERIELAAALAGFAVLCAWLMIRKNEIPGNGDLLLTVLCYWSGVRCVTVFFRRPPHIIETAAACALILLSLLIWTLRRSRKQKSPARTITDWGIAAVCTAVILATGNGILSAGSRIADFAVMAGSTLLLVINVLIAGGDSRKN